MNPERFATVKELFAAVADLPPGARAGMLRERTDDPEVIAEVLALHGAGTGGTRVARPIAAALARVAARRHEPGDTVGVWRLERRIGQGGMGSVFLAERSDGHFRQRAALKLLAGLPRREALALFARERQLLATLTHSNIARLLDGGATAEGQPYLVMEYVEGAHIDEHCRRQAFPVRAILTLFLTACEAVAFAHRQLVVHCDLKPSNLLIDGEGRPVLLDFGIARLLRRVGSEGTAAHGPRTPSVAMPAFTPGYASPEQCAHGTISTASDVYSLGMLLRQLLRGAVDRDRLSALAQRELNAVVARAIRANPAERYAGVDALTADLRRFLERRPVRALGGGAGYALQKLVARRWHWLAMAAVFLVTVAAFTDRVVLESRRARGAGETALLERDRARGAERQALLERNGAERARREAERQRDHARAAETSAIRERNRASEAEASARQISEFLVSIFDGGSPTAESGDLPVSRLIAQAESRLETELRGQDATRAELYRAMGRVQTNMGNPERARADALRAIELERPLGRPLKLAAMLLDYAAVTHSSFGTAEAEPAAREALALCERYAPETQAHAQALALLGTILSNWRKPEEGKGFLERALHLRERLDPGGLSHADALEQLAGYYAATQRFDPAVELYRRGVDLRLRRVGEQHPEYLVAIPEFARILIAARRFDEVEPLLHRALAARRRLHGNDSAIVADLLSQLASLYRETDRPFDAIPVLREQARIYRLVQGAGSAGYGLPLYNLAVIQQDVGDEAATVTGVREVLATTTGQWKDPHPSVVRMRTTLARSLMILGRIEEAKEELQRALSGRLALYGEGNAEVFRNEALLAECELRGNDLAGAGARLERMAGLASTMSGRELREYRRVRALLLGARGEVGAAVRELEEVERALADAGPTPAQLWRVRIYRAELLIRHGDAAGQTAGRALARQALDALTPLMVPEAPVLAQLRSLLPGA